MPDEMSIEEMIHQLEQGLEQMAEVGRILDKLKAALASGERLPLSANVASWPELRERIARLTASNEATLDLADQIAKLTIAINQGVTDLEQKQ
jgi:hypothetical protein